METIGMTKNYQDGSRGPISTPSDDESPPNRPAFQRCHRLQARLDAVSAGLCELNMLRGRQERLVKEALCSPLSCVDNNGEGEEQEEEEEKREEQVMNETDPGNKQEHEGQFTDPTQLMGDLVERLERIDVVNNTPDVSINSEASSRKSSGFFEALDTDIFVQSRKSSMAEMSDNNYPDMTTSGEVCRVQESGRKPSAYSLDGDVSRFVRNRAESSSLPDYNAITRAKFACNSSAGKVIALENHDSKYVGIKRALSMKTARKLSYSSDTGPDSKPTKDGSMIAKRRPCLIRSISVPEPRNLMNTESISREDHIRRKRRSVHEIDFSLHGQPGLASQCYMGSSRAFRYPSPLHAISLQSPLCLPGPGYNGKQTYVDSTQVTDSRTLSGCISGTITEEKSRVDKSEQYDEVLDAESQAPTKAPCPSPSADDLMDRCFSPTKCDNKLISHSGKTIETSPLSSQKNSILIVKEKSHNKTRHMSVDLKLENQNGTNSSVERTNRRQRPQRKGVQEQDIEASYNYNMVTSYDNSALPVPSCKQKPSNLEKISSKDTSFRSQNYFELQKGDVTTCRYTEQKATVRQEYFKDKKWLSPGWKSEFPNHINCHIGNYLSRENREVISNFSTARNSHIDSNGNYNDGVVRSKTSVRQSLSRADGRQSGTSSGMKESQRMVERFDDNKQDVPRPKPKRKNACVTPVEIWRVEYGV